MTRPSPHRGVSALVVVLAMVALACDAKTAGPAAPVDEPTAADESAGAEQTTETESRAMMVVFSRDYCTPCQVMKPWVTEIAAAHPDVDVVTLNVDRKKYEHIGSYFKVTAVPSLIFVEADGQVKSRSDGLAKKEQMTKTLKELGWAR